MADPAAGIPQLVAQLTSTEADVRAAAVEALCRAAESAPPLSMSLAAVALVAACGDDDGRVREWAVAALEDLGRPGDDGIITLAEQAASPHPLVAYWAVTLLGRCGTAAATAVPRLIGCLEGNRPLEVRQRAAWALGKIGPAAAGARDALTHAGADADPRLARLAGEALAAIGG